MIEAFQADLSNPARKKVRYLALPIRFDWHVFEQELRVVPGAYCVLLAYDGVRVGQAFCFQPLGRRSVARIIVTPSIKQ